ncbi:hypothetical protein D3C71_1584680 [compost metagenome]
MMRALPSLKLSNWAGASFHPSRASATGMIRSANNHQRPRIEFQSTQPSPALKTKKARSAVVTGRLTKSISHTVATKPATHTIGARPVHANNRPRSDFVLNQPLPKSGRASHDGLTVPATA